MRKWFQKDCLDSNWLFLRKTYQKGLSQAATAAWKAAPRESGEAGWQMPVLGQ